MPFEILMHGDDDTRKSNIVFKGKSSKHWPHLPHEVIRLIATYHLTNVQAAALCPTSWSIPQLWPSRLIFTLLRDALELEKLMWVFPTWAVAIETHRFWRQACSWIDPQEVLIQHSIVRPTGTAGSANAVPFRLTPHQHFRNITGCSCVVCRINIPYSTHGLANAKWPVKTSHLGVVMTCKEHRKISYCGVCLREAPAIEGELEYAQGLSVCCVDNEDDDTWPHVETTCRLCRIDGLWKGAQKSPINQEAVGGPTFSIDDWETKQAIDAFVDLGEGTVAEVLAVARDKYWYKVNTKLGDMLEQALAASRYVSRAELGDRSYGSEDELSSDDEDDAELKSITEDAAGIREIAVTDHVRSRILDGHWVNPADMFYNNDGWRTVVPAQHPCPWNPGAAFDGALDESERKMVEEKGTEFSHPRPKTVDAMMPPSAALSAMTYQAFMKQMKDILVPAMSNIVRRLVIECTADGRDPTMVAAAMSLDDVADALKDEATWFTGIDWLERRANARELEREQERSRRREKDEDDSSTSSRSEGSHTTSPVLSTTTLQTTPSPPPSGSVSGKDDESVASPFTSAPPVILVSPVLKSPQMLHPIPYIPLKVSHLPLYSHDAFKYAWRDACAPLYECYCSICERRILKANAAAMSNVPNQTPVPLPQDVPEAQRPVEIKVPAAPVAPVRAEEEEEGESEKDDVSVVEVPKHTSPGVTRKRPSRELDADACADAISIPGQRGGSPPKRPRKDGKYSPTPVPMSPSPARLRKRSSEELEEDDDRTDQVGNGESKRLRSEEKENNRVPLRPALPRKASLAPAVVDAAH